MTHRKVLFIRAKIKVEGKPAGKFFSSWSGEIVTSGRAARMARTKAETWPNNNVRYEVQVWAGNTMLVSVAQ